MTLKDRLFIKVVSRCDECPNCGYIHYDGEGESAPYSYSTAVCEAVPQDDDRLKKLFANKILPNALMRYKHQFNHEYQEIPKREIPDWCPMPKTEKGKGPTW